jgi:hypothetical protein
MFAELRRQFPSIMLGCCTGFVLIAVNEYRDLMVIVVGILSALGGFGLGLQWRQIINGDC